MPLVHSCAHPGCATLTMGDLCLEHERGQAVPRTAWGVQTSLRRLPPRLGRAAALTALAAAGAFAASRLPR